MAAAEQRVRGQRQDPVAELVAGDPAAGPGDVRGRAGRPTTRGRCPRPRRRRRPGTAAPGRARRPAGTSRTGPRRTSGAAPRCRAGRRARCGAPGPARRSRRRSSGGPGRGPGCPAPARRTPGPACPRPARPPRAMAARLSASAAAPGVRVGVGEEPAPAQAGHVQPGAADGGRGLGQARLGHPVPPQADRRDLVPRRTGPTAWARVRCCTVAWLSDSPRQARSPARAAARPGTAVIRLDGQARGRSSAPAAGGQLEHPDQVLGACAAACRPPSIANCGCRPLSQARNATPTL